MNPKLISLSNTVIVWLAIFPLGTISAQVDANRIEELKARAAARAQEAAARGAPGPAVGQAPGDAEAGKKAETGKPDEAEKAGKGKQEEDQPTTVQRGDKPPEPPDPAELQVEPDADGMVQFQFRNQPWPDLLRWVAGASQLTLDWQELPSDYLNLATKRPYTLAETRDLINRHLLTRGFTMLEHQGILTVVKISDLNPSMVPRVAPSELAQQQAHSFVRTSFTLSWLLADEVVEEFQSMLSPHGKLTPLSSTNRLEAMDTAVNLLDMHYILEQEQSVMALENLAREFPLKHARASAVKEQLQAFLGLEQSAGGGRAMPPDAMQMVQRQMQQMQQQMQQAQANTKGKASAPSGEEKVYLVANERNNSIIVHAPPDKMAIIVSFLSRVDVPNENSASFQRLETRMKVFRLASLGPAELVASLSAMDVLEPTTRLQVDEENKAIIAYASVADQYLIQSVIDRLDGSARSLHVISLRRLGAESVAGSIKFLMGAEDEEPKQDNRRSYFSYYDPYGSRNQTKKSEDKLRVGANVQDNQILLWANENELEEVQNLLVKLGELPPEGGRRSTTRILGASRHPETYEYLQRLQEQWERVSPNPLIIPDAQEFQPPEDEDEDEEGVAGGDESESADDSPQTSPRVKIQNNNTDSEQVPKTSHPAATDKVTSRAELSERRLVSAPVVSAPVVCAAVVCAPGQPVGGATANAPAAGGPNGKTTTGSEGDEEKPTSPTPQPEVNQDQSLVTQDQKDFSPSATTETEPIRITIDKSGNLIIQSNDLAALDRLEEIMQTDRPPRKPYDVFKVKHASASWVTLNLEEYFDKKEEDPRSRFFSFIYGFGNQEENKSPQLGNKPELRFIYDNDTNSIVVQGADDVDRQTIKELIELWDVPEPIDDEGVRYSRLIRVKYSRADAIVSTIKDAYRDLLSSNDKAFQQNEKEGRGGAAGSNESKRSSDGQGVNADSGMNYNFRGKLSLGSDTLTNSILVSAEGKDLLQLVGTLIQELDDAARPEGNFEVYSLKPGSNGKSVIAALRAMLQAPGRNSQSPAPSVGGQRGEGQRSEQPAPNGEVNLPVGQ
jgi:type II secretory pathway component GspD/PulD (secretin)